ncbi:MAG: hypothetical protein JSV23_02740 [Promethearchaeota archaeon]|nr:MAG: hypothetical protein JSV23_02740 [Candidatus Lokiarchaeota archaeon]
MGEERELTAPKIILIIAMLFMLAEGVMYFYLSDVAFTGDSLLILFGILNLVFIFLIFISLDLVGTGPVKIPYFWWLMLIIGVLLIVFSYLIADFWGYAYLIASLGFAGLAGVAPYLTGSLVLLAVIIEIMPKLKDMKASKTFALFGIGFAIWDSVFIFIPGFATQIAMVNAVFGIILAIVLLILVLDLIDIKIPFTWWVLLTIAFVIWMWVSPFAVYINLTNYMLTLTFYPVVGWGGLFLMISFVLMLLDK